MFRVIVAACICISTSTPLLAQRVPAPQVIRPETYWPKPLAKKITFDFQDTPLSEVAKELEAELKIPVKLNQAALDDVGLDVSVPVTAAAKDEPAIFLTNFIDSQLELATYFRDGTLFISTPEDVETDQLVKADYDVRRLLAAGYDPDQLVELIISCVAPYTWEDIGASGTIALANGKLSVEQTDEVHRMVAMMLEGLTKPTQQTMLNVSIYDEKAIAQLNKRVTFEVDGDPWTTPLKKLEADLGVPVKIDVRSLDDAGVSTRTPVTFKTKDTPLAEALTELLKMVDLAFLIRDGAILIVSPAEAELDTPTAIYYLGDVKATPDLIQNTIEKKTDPALWDSAGGSGSMEFARTDVLVISNSRQVHNKVLELLTQHRKAAGR